MDFDWIVQHKICDPVSGCLAMAMNSPSYRKLCHECFAAFDTIGLIDIQTSVYVWTALQDVETKKAILLCK